MGETSAKTTGKARKPYAKPQVSRVKLQSEEAVLGFCKSTSRSGPVQSRCNQFVNCRSIGS